MREIFRNFVAGSFVFSVIGLGITFGIYPLIARLANNYILGLSIMFFSSVTIRYIMILSYDFLKVDYLLIESLKAKKEHKGNNLTKRIKKLKKMGNFILFLFLIFFDPFLTAIYYRPSHDKWNGLENVGILFLLSNFLCVTFAGTIMSFLVSLF